MESDWQKWKREQEEKQRAKQPPIANPEKKKRKKTEWRQITPDELSKVQRLLEVTCAPGSSDKRFLSSFRNSGPDTKITDAMVNYIDILWYKYRRQLKHNDPKPDGYN